MALKVASAMITGRGREAKGLLGQDYAFSLKKDNTACIALCDGVGSLENSGYAAEKIAKAVCEYMVENFSILKNMSKETIRYNIFRNAKKAFDNAGYDKETMASTLIAACSDGEEIIIVHIGDGIAFLKEEAEAVVISSPENDPKTGAVYAISENADINHLRVQKVHIDNKATIMITSDGPMNSLYNSMNKKIASATDTMMKWLEGYPEEIVCKQLEKNLAEVFRKNSADDLSIAILYADRKGL